MKKQTKKAPGKAHRKGITLFQITEMFPSEDKATQWFEETLWPNERCCGHCGSVRTKGVPNRKPMPYWCSDCRSYCSVRTGTPIAKTNLPLRKWAMAIYLELTSLKRSPHDSAASRPCALRRPRDWHATPDRFQLEAWHRVSSWSAVTQDPCAWLPAGRTSKGRSAAPRRSTRPHSRSDFLG